MLTEKEVCERYNFTLEYLRQMIEDGRGPKFYRPTPRVKRFAEADLQAWVKSWDVSQPKELHITVQQASNS